MLLLSHMATELREVLNNSPGATEQAGGGSRIGTQASEPTPQPRAPLAQTGLGAQACTGQPSQWCWARELPIYKTNTIREGHTADPTRDQKEKTG